MQYETVIMVYIQFNIMQGFMCSMRSKDYVYMIINNMWTHCVKKQFSTMCTSRE